MTKLFSNQYCSYKIPSNYYSKTTGLKLENQIYDTLNIFETTFKKILNLHKIRSPIFIESNQNLNDGLNGEKPARFNTNDGKEFELVHSLAKWKRMQLDSLKLNSNEGIVTNMKAIRREEFMDNIHSIFVDQWDWEIKINKEDRNLKTLIEVVNKIFNAIYFTANMIEDKYNIKNKLPKEIKFITTQELENEYPNLTPKEREHKIAREFKAVCLIGIGNPLEKSKVPHDNRASDYDDWSTPIELNGIKTYGLNCDILLYNEILGESLEICSMGIRVDKDALLKQNKYLNESEYINRILNEKICYSIGGGIGQSRLLMYFLRKCHIGEVQVSSWISKEWLIENGVEIL